MTLGLMCMHIYMAVMITHCHTLKLNDFQLFQLLPGCDFVY